VEERLALSRRTGAGDVIAAGNDILLPVHRYRYSIGTILLRLTRSADVHRCTLNQNTFSFVVESKICFSVIKFIITFASPAGNLLLIISILSYCNVLLCYYGRKQSVNTVIAVI
jgi:hypothetical protein